MRRRPLTPTARAGWRDGKAPIGAFPRRSGRRPSRTIRTWRRPWNTSPLPTRTGSGRRRRTQGRGRTGGGVDIIATMPLTAQGRPWGIGRIFLLPRSGQIQPERPRGADPGVTPWFHALGQKRVVRSGVAQVLSTIWAVTQTVLLSQRKCLFFSSLSCGGHGIRSTLGVEIGSGRWLPRIGSVPSDENGRRLATSVRVISMSMIRNPPSPGRRPALVVELGRRQP